MFELVESMRDGRVARIDVVPPSSYGRQRRNTLVPHRVEWENCRSAEKSGGTMGSKVRLFAQRGESDDFRYLAWFKLDGSHDLHWGGPKPALDTPAMPVPGGQKRLTMDPPDGWEALPEVSVHRTYHESGVMHVQAPGGEHASVRDVWLGRPEDITGPTLVEILISKPFSHMEPYRRKLDRDGANPAVLRIPDELWHRRWNFEFHLTPSGQVSFPDPELKVPAGYKDHLSWFTLDVERDRLIAIRAYPTLEDFSNVPPDERVLSYSILPGSEYAAMKAARAERS